MKVLDKEFTNRDIKYKQIYREGVYAIYETTSLNNRFPVHWEVIEIEKHKAFQFLGKPYVPEGEQYPHPNDWGKMGYTCLTRQDAYARLDMMKKDEIIKKTRKTKHKD